MSLILLRKNSFWFSMKMMYVSPCQAFDNITGYLQQINKTKLTVFVCGCDDDIH